jgi:hypothetical protein
MNGSILPATVTRGSYEIRELGTGVGTLYEGKVVYDKTYGEVTYGCAACCAYKAAMIRLLYNPLGIPYGLQADQGIEAWNTCSDLWEDITLDFFGTWATGNTGIATVDVAGTHTGVSPGSTTTYTGPTDEQVQTLWNKCPIQPVGPQGGDNVTPIVTISGPSGVPLLNGGTANGVNTIQLTATGTPSGGTFSWSTTSQNVTLSNTSSATVTVTSVSKSGSQGDTPVSVTYTVNGQSGAATQNLTVQQPTSQSIVAGTSSTTAETSCTVNAPGSPTGCGVTRTFTWQVLDQFGSAMPFTGMQFWDSITLGSTNQLYMGSTFTTTCTPQGKTNSGPCQQTTNSSGQFFETSPGLSVCSTVCYTNGSCIAPSAETTAAQVYTVNGFATESIQLTYECNKILVNGN